ncbi:MAG TPA: Ig-like domain-containing protein, partial [Verrucomicrobiae bacterium]
NEDTYLTLTFSDWGRFFSGSFTYTRSTPSAVTPPTPTISITSPANNAVFAAPANVKFTVNAAVSSGSVTNVSFFNNASKLGSSQTPPFNFTSGALGAGSYPVTAVATAAGISATSSVVNVSVVTPVTTSLSAPAAANNQFSFNYSANAGLRYVIETSSNLFNWTPVVTNTASSSSASFTTNILPANDFYRVGRMPNP